MDTIKSLLFAKQLLKCLKIIKYHLNMSKSIDFNDLRERFISLICNKIHGKSDNIIKLQQLINVAKEIPYGYSSITNWCICVT